MPATIIASGRLTKDAETRQAGNSTVVSFSVAVSCFERKEKLTRYYDCSYFGKRAEQMVGMLTKGTAVSVTGAHSTREHAGKTYQCIDVWNVELLGGRPRSEQQPAATPRNQYDDATAPDGPVDDMSGDSNWPF